MASRLNRAQVLASNISATGANAVRKMPELYSDFLNSFSKTPVGNGLARVVNERSINQSLKNIILTNKNERLFNPNFGSNINMILFENNTESVISALNFYIRNAIEREEPRVELIDVILDSSERDNAVTINIVYRTLFSQDIQNFTFILKRVR